MIVPFASNLDLVRELVQSYRDASRKPATLPAPSKFQSSLHCYVAETHQEAIEGYQRPVERYIEVFAEAVSSWAGQQSNQYAGYNKLVEAISSLTAQKMIDSHTALVGTPEEVIEQVEFNRDLIGEHEPSMQINFGGIKDREAFRTLELFAAHVLPRFQTQDCSSTCNPELEKTDLEPTQAPSARYAATSNVLSKQTFAPRRTRRVLSRIEM